MLPVQQPQNRANPDDYPLGVRTNMLGAGSVPSPLGALVCLPVKWVESPHLGRIIERLSSDKWAVPAWSTGAGMGRAPAINVAHRTQGHCCDG